MSDENREQALLSENRRLHEAWNNHDIDTIYDIEKESIGFGYRTPDIRMSPKPEWKQLIAQWFSSMKEFSSKIDEENVRIVGDTGLAWGWFTEKIVEHDESVRYVKVRYTSTWIETDDGWKHLMYHRDNIF